MSDLEITRDLVRELSKLRFGPPITHVYNPLEYAFEPHRLYVERYGAGTRELLLLGMNPGPFGMAQTGVPFGDVAMVRDWLKIEAPVDKPKREHPKRPVTGFSCPRSEVSGTRIWGWARDTFGTPERFFSRFFVINYCPLVFMEESGKNFTPDKLCVEEREKLQKICDRALRRTVERMQPRWLIGVGAFAEERAKQVLGGLDVRIGRLPHPSPASPAANRGWAEAATKALRDLDIGL